MADNDADSAALFAGFDTLDDDLAVSAFLDNSPPPSDPPTSAGVSSTGAVGDFPFCNSSAPSSSVPAISTSAETQPFISPASAPDWGLEDSVPYDTYNGNPFDTTGLCPQLWDFRADATASGHHIGQARHAGFSLASNLRPNATPDDAVIRPNLRPEILHGLTLAQQEKLKSIAMPAHLQYHSPKSEPSPGSSMSGNEKGAASSPDTADPSKAGSRKRKSTDEVEDDDDYDEIDGQQPVKKTAHNMIEKRYRTNLNDKIAALRDSVPALRIMSKSARGEDTTEDREELHGLTPAHKLNKATVLSKATEYIRHLEKRNNRLIDENNSMQARISAFEKLFMAGALTSAMPSSLQHSPPLQYAQGPQQYMNTPMATPRGMDPPGMIQVPEDMRKILAAQQVAAGQSYAIPAQSFQTNPTLTRQQQIQQQQQQQQQASRWTNGAPYFGKLMVGSLAGLMIVEAIRENEQSNESPGGRGLFALPVQLLMSFVNSTHFTIGGYTISTARFFSSLKLLILLGAMLWAFVPSLFASKPPKSGEKAFNPSLRGVPSLASPIHVRRQAWLTAIQTVWVPRHNFFLEAAALVLKTMKFTLRNTMGVRGYQLLTGLTEEQETARIKAWTIALDAQLAGGDVEINKSRLTLTLLASGTLPDTPQRLMLKALHIRVLLWQVDILPGIFNVLASKLARSNWNEAKHLNRLLNQLRKGSNTGTDDDLPDHLSVLLEQDCDDVLNDDVVQRAHNLAWNRHTAHNALDMIDGMNSVVDDTAVRSPMDAVSAWYSSAILQRILASNLGGERHRTTEADLDLAVKVAPIGSNAQVRALVARTFLLDKKRGANIAAAMQAMQPSIDTEQSPQYTRGAPLPLIDSRMAPNFPDPDTHMALRCSQGIAHLQKFHSPPQWALDVINTIVPPPGSEGMSLLSFTAAFHLMDLLRSHPVGREACSASLEMLAGSLRIWVGGSGGDGCGLDQDLRRKMVDCCLAVTKSVVGMEADPGYGSMSDREDEEGGC